MSEYSAAVPLEAPPYIVFGAIQTVAQQDQGRIQANHNGWRRLLLKQKRSMTNWGNLVWFEVAPGTHPNNCIVNIEVSLAPDGHSSLGDEWAHKSQGKKYLKKVQEALGQQPESLADFLFDSVAGEYRPWDGQRVSLPSSGRRGPGGDRWSKMR